MENTFRLRLESAIDVVLEVLPDSEDEGPPTDDSEDEGPPADDLEKVLDGTLR